MANSNTPDAPVEEPAVDAPVLEGPVADTTKDGYPLGVRIFEPKAFEGEDAPERTWVGEHEYVIDTKTGRITGRA